MTDHVARVSIVVNNFNYERFLAAAIESALAQTHPDTEVVVVDDGSTDGSRELVARYGDRVVPVFKENGGQASDRRSPAPRWQSTKRTDGVPTGSVG